MSELSEHDAAVKQWLSENPCINEKPWIKGQIKSVQVGENPFNDPKAAKVNLPQHPSVSLMAPESLSVITEVVKKNAPEYKKEQKEFFRTDFTSKDIERKPMENLNTDAVSAITLSHPDTCEHLNYEAPTFTQPSEDEFLCLAYTGVKLGFDAIEPITFSTFILDGSNVISESWEYFDSAYRAYFDHDHITNAAFNIRNRSQDAYLVTVCNRCYMGDSGDVLSNYYLKKSTKTRDAAKKTFSTSYSRFRGKWNAFGFTFYSLKDIEQSILMPKVYLCDQTKTFTGEYLQQQIERAKDGRLDQIDMELSFMANISCCPNPNTIEEAVVLDSTTPRCLRPDLVFNHKLIVNLNFGRFDDSGGKKNIIVEVMVLKDGKPLKCIHSRWDNDDLTESVFSRVVFHDKTPAYADQFIIELPVPCEGVILFKLYNLSSKPKEKPLQYFGNASIVLSPHHDQFLIADGKKKLGITYGEKSNPNAKATQSNFLSITTQLRSSLVTNEPTLKDIYRAGGEVPVIDSIPNDVLIYNLYQVLDSLLRNISKNPSLAISGLISLHKYGSILSAGQIESYLMNYATELAFRDGAGHDENAYKYLLRGWTASLKKLENVGGSDRKDIFIMDFIFAIIIKGIIRGNREDFDTDLNAFVEEWARSVCALSERGYAQAQKMIIAYARFTSMLCDIGLYSAATICVNTFIANFGDKGAENRVLVNYLERSFSPLLFITETVTDNSFTPTFINLFTSAVNKSASDPIQQVFTVYARALAFVPEELRSLVAAKIVGFLSSFNVSIQGTTDQLWAPLSIVSFILKYIKCEDFAAYFSQLMNKSAFADFIHFFATNTRFTKQVAAGPVSAAVSNVEALNTIEKQFATMSKFGTVKAAAKGVRGFRNFKSLRGSMNIKPAAPSYVPSKDIALEAQLAMVNTINHLLNMEEPDLAMANDFLYHILSMNIAIEAVDGIVKTISNFANDHIKFLIECREPPFVLVLKKILSLVAAKNKYTSDKFATIFPIMIAAEKEAYGTNNRLQVQILRAISLLKIDDLSSTTLLDALTAQPEEEFLSSVIAMIKKINAIDTRLEEIDKDGFVATFKPDFERAVNKASKQTEMDEYSELLWKRACLFRHSPDAVLDALVILDQFHAANDYKIESIVVKIVQCSLIAEYLSLLNLMPHVFNKDHAALSFTKLTPVAETFIVEDAVRNDIPEVPGFCDSPRFCEAGMVSILYDIADFCQTESLFEIMNQTLQVFVPLFEYHQMYEELQSLFSKCKDYYTFLKGTTKTGERLMGKYYRVCFFGECFKSDNGKMYIYRETKLTNLFNLTNRFEATYGKLLPPGKLEIIKEAGAVDTRLLEPDKGYIQITFVNPTFDKKEANNKQTTFDINTHIHKFSFDTPFMKGSKKLQGSVETQWLRRTFLNIREEMPNVVKRIELHPTDIVNVEYEPIRVSCRQLKDRLGAYENAIQEKSISQIQPLLNGSLCVQVNEGPTKMAEVFLGGNLKTKYTEKMRAVFKRFLELNKIALEIHREAAAGNPSFAALQEQMDIGFKSLTEKLEPYLNK